MIRGFINVHSSYLKWSKTNLWFSDSQFYSLLREHQLMNINKERRTSIRNSVPNWYYSFNVKNQILTLENKRERIWIEYAYDNKISITYKYIQCCRILISHSFLFLIMIKGQLYYTQLNITQLLKIYCEI